MRVIACCSYLRKRGSFARRSVPAFGQRQQVLQCDVFVLAWEFAVDRTLAALRHKLSDGPFHDFLCEPTFARGVDDVWIAIAVGAVVDRGVACGAKSKRPRPSR
jgi:hypothetical protein